MLFIEAKVGTRKEIVKEFSAFEKSLSTQASSSNLFTQIYHKQRLMLELKNNGITDTIKNEGVEFPSWSTCEKRKLGKRTVVLCAAEMIKKHSDKAFYLMLVPDSHSVAKEFFSTKRHTAFLKRATKSDIQHYGFLTWGTVESFCKKHELENTANVFEYNGEQIYKKATAKNKTSC